MPASPPGTWGANPAATGARGAAFNPYPGFHSDYYAQDNAWACKPGRANNPCVKDLDATEVLPDGTTKPAPESAVSEMHPIDCFYLYPTVGRSGSQMSRDFSNATSIDNVVRSQAARFSRVCNLYVPYYRLVSLEDTMGGRGDIELAYADVVESFKHYLANFSEGRSFVLLGHSQGSNHGLRLLREQFDNSPELIARMVSAIMLGFPVQLPMGQATGGTFKRLPICQKPEQSGCLINFMSYAMESPPPAMGNAQFGAIDVCTNPAALGGGPALFQGTYFPTQGSPLASKVTTPWVLYRNFIRGECKRTSGGTAYMEIARANQSGDQRMSFYDPNNALGAALGIGLHVMDYVFSQGDLIDLVAKQSAALPAQP